MIFLTYVQLYGNDMQCEVQNYFDYKKSGQNV